MAKKIVIIGGGPGGYVAALRASQLGAEVTLIEKQHIGGTCLNIGCIPTKCLLESAELVETIRNRGTDLGVTAEKLSIDFKQIMAHKDSVSKQLSGGVRSLLKMAGVSLIMGTAAFANENTLEVSFSDGGSEQLTADAFVIATGAVNAVPPIPGLAKSTACIDSTGALSLKELPKSLLVIGGGVIGLELACAFASFGTKVDVVEALDYMLPMLDSDICTIGIKHMESMGIRFHLSCPVQSVEDIPNGARVHCRDSSGKEVLFEAEKVLVAVGRRADTGGLQLDRTGVLCEHGRIIVNSKMQTSISDIYAIGDCVAGHAQLAHTASVMGETAVENIMGLDTEYNEATNPTSVFIMPEASSVGLTEKQAKELGLHYKVGKFPLMANGRALILNGGEGLIKVILGEPFGEVLGVHIIGPRASDLIAEAALAIRLEATADEIISTIHGHPTVSEALREAFLASEHRTLHMPD